MHATVVETGVLLAAVCSMEWVGASAAAVFCVTRATVVATQSRVFHATGCAISADCVLQAHLCLAVRAGVARSVVADAGRLVVVHDAMAVSTAIDVATAVMLSAKLSDPFADAVADRFGQTADDVDLLDARAAVLAGNTGAQASGGCVGVTHCSTMTNRVAVVAFALS